MSLRRIGELDIDQDLPFQVKAWRAQRVAWAGMALVIVGGLVGAFGSGPLAAATTGSPPLTIAYERIDRKHSPTRFSITVDGAATESGKIELWFANDLLDRLIVDEILPEPQEVRAGAERTVFVFTVAVPGEPAAITFDYEPDNIGRHHARIGLVSGPERAFTMIVLP